MKICIFSPLYKPWYEGGAEKYAISLAEELSKIHQVTVITTQGPSIRKIEDFINPNVIELNPWNIEKLYNIALNEKVPSSKKILWHLFDIWNFNSYNLIKKILEKRKPDIVHINGIKGFSSSLFSAVKKLKIPLVYTIHDFELISKWTGHFRSGKIISRYNFLDNLYINMMKRASSRIDAVISPSKFLLDYHVKLGYFSKTRKYVVPNGIKLRTQIGKQNFSSEFLYLGQIIETKGSQIAIQAFKKIKNANCRLHIVGNGKYFPKVKELAKSDSRIILHGFVGDGEKLDSIINRCSYFIFPSLWYENYPYALIEILNRGLPIIASDIGGIPEIIKNDYNGILFEPGDYDSLANNMENLISNSINWKKMSQNAFESSKSHSLEKQLKETLKVYSDVLSEK